MYFPIPGSVPDLFGMKYSYLEVVRMLHTLNCNFDRLKMPSQRIGQQDMEYTCQMLVYFRWGMIDNCCCLHHCKWHMMNDMVAFRRNRWCLWCSNRRPVLYLSPI